MTTRTHIANIAAAAIAAAAITTGCGASTNKTESRTHCVDAPAATSKAIKETLQDGYTAAGPVRMDDRQTDPFKWYAVKIDGSAGGVAVFVTNGRLIYSGEAVAEVVSGMGRNDRLDNSDRVAAAQACI